MRLLHVNKFHWPKGGSERYYFDCVNGLSARGHEVAVFASAHPSNVASPWSKHFAPGADYHGAGPSDALRLAGHVIDNQPAARALEGLLREFRPEVAHLHNIHHQLSPAILAVLERAGVPVVQTLHDYKWVCPAYLFLSHGKVCEKCGPGNDFFPVVTHTCHHDSFPKSLVVWRELTASWGRGDVDRVKRFLAPSRFLRDRVVAHGLPNDRVETRSYFLDVAAYRPADAPSGDHFLYAGRLSKEKGLSTLVAALARRPGLKPRVAGAGPLESELRERARAENLD
ncbi:MAG TPA: glycosyltransferase, partial [Candidatus Eisenbacteria bacterium]